MRSAAVSVLALLLLLATCVSARIPAHRRGVESAAEEKAGEVDGWNLVRKDAQWWSVCEANTQATPKFPPPASPIGPPLIDAATSAVKLQLVAGQNESCIAWGFHSDTIETVGWAYLSVQTNAAYPDWLQSRAAGYLEGAISQERIYQMITNLLPQFYPSGSPSPAVLAWFNETLRFKTDLLSEIGQQDPYWSLAGGLYLQVQGMFEGYSAAVQDPSQVLSWFLIYSLQLDVDLGDVTMAVGLYSPLASAAEKAAAEAKVAAKVAPTADASMAETHCSALVKILPGNTDLIMGHTTWSHYYTMLRTFKLYNMPLKAATGSSVVHMSSYPGFLFSSDDWYQLLPSQLTVTETSNDIYAHGLYALIQPGSVEIWARTLLANRLATDGASWVEVFSRYNSGTCDNQWIIVDHKKFVAGSVPLAAGLLTVSEQMPGAFVTKDMTSVLNELTYWSSFNIPAFNETYAVSGFDLCPGGAYVCSWSENFRHLLFVELQGKVVDVDSMKNVLLYNEWQTDPIQRNSSGYAIAARRDLMPTPSAYGSIDGKITLDSWMKQGDVRLTAYSGPTTQTQKPFCWGGQFAQPLGIPTCFDFPWIQFAAAPSAGAALPTDELAEW